MENIFNNPAPESDSKAGFIAKNNIIYKVHNPAYIDSKAVHFGYLSINEFNQANNIQQQVVNFGGKVGGYLFPIK